MRNILTIMKKELKRFFTDHRMILTLILPGLMIFIVYSLMGTIMTNMITTDDSYVYKLIIVNSPIEEDFKNIVNFSNLNNDVEIEYVSEHLEVYFEQVTNEEIDLYIIYPLNFYNDALNYDKNVNVDLSPEVQVFYNNSKIESYEIYSTYLMLISSFKDSISEKFAVNRSPIQYDLSTSESQAILFIVSLIPFLLVIFLFSGAMSVSIESIAGEKERGTIATILATPIKRIELVLGKVFSLSIAALTSATSSFLGLMLSFPKLAGDINIDISFYGFKEYFLLFLVITSTTILYVVLISIISTFAKSVKEASGLSSILMVFNMVLSITSMGGHVSTKTISYLIPIYNSLQAITSILSTKVNYLNLSLTFVSNITLILLAVLLLSKMFNSEKIMFQK